MYPHFVQMECTRQKGGGVLFAHPICDCIIEIEKKNSKNREKAILFLFLSADREKKTMGKRNETKQNKTHKNGNEKINFHLNGCLRLHINATYTLHIQ